MAQRATTAVTESVQDQLSETNDSPRTLRFCRLPHAPLHERYMYGEFHDVGESGKADRRIDPNTGSEFRVLARSDEHDYLRDYRIPHSYPPTLFVFGQDDQGDSVSHSGLKSALEEHDLWRSGYSEVIVPQGTKYGQPVWDFGYILRPPEHAPSSIRRLNKRFERRFDEDQIFAMGPSVELIVADDG